MSRARWCLALAVVVAVPVGLEGQSSQLGIHGPGMPGRAESARARATGGGFSAFDALSPLTEAVLADLRRLTAGAEGLASFRNVDLGGAEGHARATRFPGLIVAGPPLGGSSPLVVSAGYGIYLDKTFRVSVRDSALIRGNLERFSDVTSSEGAVADVRIAGGWRIAPRIAIGAAVHLLSGANRATASRQFDDSATYHNTFESADVQQTGMGFSASVLVDPASSLRLGLWFRSDSRLVVSVADTVKATYDLPTSIGGALRWALSSELRFAGSVATRSWEDAGGRNTVEWTFGAETGNPRFPVRLGFRGATLPFAPAGVDATEWAVAGGFGRAFSEGRARIDVGVDRLTRSGGDLREVEWTLFVGLTLQP